MSDLLFDFNPTHFMFFCSNWNKLRPVQLLIASYVLRQTGVIRTIISSLLTVLLFTQSGSKYSEIILLTPQIVRKLDHPTVQCCSTDPLLELSLKMY